MFAILFIYKTAVFYVSSDKKQNEKKKKVEREKQKLMNVNEEKHLQWCFHSDLFLFIKFFFLFIYSYFIRSVIASLLVWQKMYVGYQRIWQTKKNGTI